MKADTPSVRRSIWDRAPTRRDPLEGFVPCPPLTEEQIRERQARLDELLKPFRHRHRLHDLRVLVD